MEIFTNDNLNVEVATLVDGNGDILFRGNDVAVALGYERPRKAIMDHVDGDYKTTPGEMGAGPVPLGTHPNTVFIKETGVYALIFRSKLPAARSFQRWVFSDVLPSIRKTGRYAITDPVSKIRSITVDDPAGCTPEERSDYKAAIRMHDNMLKDPRKVERGRRGGQVSQRN